MRSSSSRSERGHTSGQADGAREQRQPRTRHVWLLRCCLRFCSRCVNFIRLCGKPGHHRRVRAARRVLRVLRRMEREGAPARIFAYVRQIDALTFEEVVLSALEDAGYLVLRNQRYSGDGGIDGAFWHSSLGWCAIQVKRYRSHIDRQDVIGFTRAIRHAKFDGGVFVHCGRSGAGVYNALRENNVVLLSGEGLVRLMLRGELPP